MFNESLKHKETLIEQREREKREQKYKAEKPTKEFIVNLAHRYPITVEELASHVSAGCTRVDLEVIALRSSYGY